MGLTPFPRHTTGMTIRNVVFDVGGVLLEWNPPASSRGCIPDPATQAVIRQQMFEHADWHEFDRGTLSYDGGHRAFRASRPASRPTKPAR